MLKQEVQPVIIIGAGPVGLIAAMDLATRGVSSIVLEMRSDEAPAHPRCNTTSARTMELLRRIGCDKEYRACGLDPDYPNDVTFSTEIGGQEITRYYLPSVNARWQNDRMAHDGGWRSSERPHRASQFYLERVLREHAASFSEIDVRFYQEVTKITQHDSVVDVEFKDTRTGEEQSLTAKYLLGCDGGRSVARRQSGIKMSGGYTGLGMLQSILFRSKDVLPKFEKNGRGWMNWCIGPDGSMANIIAIDGHDLWLTHMDRSEDQTEVSDEAIEQHLATVLGDPIDYEVLNTEMWQLNRVVAEDYRSGRVFLAGDAAHSWPPWAGHGMNSGIEDGIGITWMIAAVLKGWAPESILDAYNLERQEAGERTSRAAEGMAAAQLGILRDKELCGKLGLQNEEGEKAREIVTKRLWAEDSRQFNPEGLNFGLFYDRSPLIIYDDGVPPEYEVEIYTPTTVPGCRTPYFAMIDDGSSIYDHQCDGYTLIRTDENVDVSGLAEAAEACGMPFKVIDIGHHQKACRLYDHKLVLVRPDNRVAWRSNESPLDAKHIIDKLRGAA
ncbi:MAG: FAD-dependent monooxygenase [Emcibacter sp.]|nr:FAD-dependent monooxygenase [Emcibacter sp.]